MWTSAGYVSGINGVFREALCGTVFSSMQCLSGSPNRQPYHHVDQAVVEPVWPSRHAQATHFTRHAGNMPYMVCTVWCH